VRGGSGHARTCAGLGNGLGGGCCGRFCDITLVTRDVGGGERADQTHRSGAMRDPRVVKRYIRDVVTVD
jgi:hypothetical protein